MFLQSFKTLTLKAKCSVGVFNSIFKCFPLTSVAKLRREQLGKCKSNISIGKKPSERPMEHINRIQRDGLW